MAATEWFIWTTQDSHDHLFAVLLEVRDVRRDSGGVEHVEAVRVGLTRDEARSLAGELLTAVDPAPSYPPNR